MEGINENAGTCPRFVMVSVTTPEEVIINTSSNQSAITGESIIGDIESGAKIVPEHANDYNLGFKELWPVSITKSDIYEVDDEDTTFRLLYATLSIKVKNNCGDIPSGTDPLFDFSLIRFRKDGTPYHYDSLSRRCGDNDPCQIFGYANVNPGQESEPHISVWQDEIEDDSDIFILK